VFYLADVLMHTNYQYQYDPLRDHVLQPEEPGACASSSQPFLLQITLSLTKMGEKLIIYTLNMLCNNTLSL
jgi:hypothetical protein